MYAVYLKQDVDSNQELIHAPYVDALKLIDAKITKSVGAIDSFDFTIYPNHPAYNKLHYLTSLIEVWNNQTNRLLFKGRVLEPYDTMDSNGQISKEVTCEGELAYLHDSLQKWGKWQNMTPAQFFKALIDEHNSQVEPYKQFAIGKIDVTNSTDNVYRYTDDDVDTYDTIKDKLIDRLGGELQVRYVDGIRVIDYLKQTGQKGTQKIELASNLKSISRAIDPTELATIIKPLGARLEQEDNNADASAPRLTIASVNNGSVYLRDEDKIKQFGVRVLPIVFDDVTQAANLKSKGQDFLVNQKTALVKYQLDAIDLAPLNLSVEAFECGWTHDIYNPLMGIDEPLRIIGQTIDINNPTGSSLSIGDKILTQEQLAMSSKKQLQAAEKVAEILRSQVDSQSKKINNLQRDLTDAEQKIVDEITVRDTINDDLVNRIKKIEGGVSPEQPNVFPKEIRTVFRNDLARIKSRLLESDFNLALGTDFHCDQTQTSSYGVNTKNAYSHLANLMYFSDKADVTIINGDNLHAIYPELDDIKSEYTDLVNAMTSRTYASDVFVHIGNHDDGSSRPDLTENNVPITDGFIKDAEFRQLLKTSERKFGETRNNGDSLYYYKDYPNKKIRLIGLNTSDINETMTNSEGYLKYRRLNLHTIRQTQLDWLANVALRNVPADYHTLIVAHCPLRESWINRPDYINQNIILAVLKAFKTGGTCNASSSNVDFPLVANYDFTSQGARNFVAWFSGHTHREAVNDWDGIKIVECLHSVGNGGNQQNVVTEDAQTIVSINTDSRNIKLRGFGRATDRVVNY